MRMPVESSPPTQADLDALFARARRVRIVEGGAAGGRPLGRRVLATLAGDELAALRAALRIVEDGPRFQCMCHGDLAIDVRGRLLRIGVLSYHHGQSIRLEGAGSDVDLVDGPALLRLLASRGVGAPLAAHEAGVAADEERSRAAAQWRAAAPAGLRERLDALESGPMGLPRHEHDPAFDDAVAVLRAAGTSDRALAAALMRWLGGRDGSPWSGHPACEQVPLVLLRRLAPAEVLTVIDAVDDEAGLLGAARLLAEHEVVSFRKRMVAAVPLSRFDAFERRLERTAMDREALEDARARLQRARGIATGVHARRSRQAAELARERDRALACVAVSEDGPFGDLATDGERLVALDVYTVVEVEVDNGTLTPLHTYTGSPFTTLVGGDGALFVLRSNEGRLERLEPGAAPTVVAEGLPRPLHPVAYGGVVCMVCAPFEDHEHPSGIRTSRQRTALARLEPDGSVATVLPVERGVAALAADATHLYFASTDLEGKGVIERVARHGGAAQRLVAVGACGHALARPRLVVDAEHLVYADGPAVCRVPVAGGRAQTLAKLAGPVGALTVVDGGVVAIVGGMSDAAWHVERIGWDGARHRVGSLPRAPYHRVVLVTRRGQAFFVLDDRLYRVR
jgi:hypothetical protein